MKKISFGVVWIVIILLVGMEFYDVTLPLVIRFIVAAIVSLFLALFIGLALVGLYFGIKSVLSPQRRGYMLYTIDLNTADNKYYRVYQEEFLGFDIAKVDLEYNKIEDYFRRNKKYPKGISKNVASDETKKPLFITAGVVWIIFVLLLALITFIK